MRRRGAGGESETDSEQETTKGKGKGKEREVIEMVHDGDEPDGAIGASTLLQPDGTKPESRKKRKAGKKVRCFKANMLAKLTSEGGLEP